MAGAPSTSMNGPGFEARALGAMFGAGGLLGLIAAVVPHGEEVHTSAWAINSTLGLPVAGVLFLLAERVPTWVLHVLIAIGGVLVSLSMIFGAGGHASVAASFFFVWVALYAFWFFPTRAAIAHITAASIVLAVVMYVQEVHAAPAVWLLLMGTAAVVGVVVTFMRHQLIAATTTDSLTNIPTRQVFAGVYAREVARARRRKTPLCVAILDLDDLKVVNDRDGHAAGDRVLRDAVTAWRGALRESDVLIRYGGDEFVAILPDCDHESAEQVMHRLRLSTDAAWSYGVACWRDGDTTDDVLARADAELYSAKRRSDA